MSDILDKVLQEAITWENKPISELLGTDVSNDSDYSKQIIMYGATQVGKTTLVLDLMGIKSDKRVELNKIVKGGSKTGAASTSSAIIYSGWDRDVFGLATKNIYDFCETNPEELNAEDFKNKIKSINQQNRKIDGESTKESDIYCYYIPRYYFDDSSPLKNLQIIDLPGFGERNEKMRKRADEIISFFSQIVAGAIIVVKSENIQNLESDYKEFISKQHFNHLAIAISYAASTGLKGVNIEGLSEDELANSIPKHFYDLITTSQYINLGNIKPNEIIFPIEEKAYLEKNSSHLIGTFDIIRKRLLNRVAAMCNRTSIGYCVEKLENKTQVLKKEIEAFEKNLKAEEAREKELKLHLADIEKKKENKDMKLIQKSNDIGYLQQSKDEILSRVKSFEKISFEESNAKALWDNVKKSDEHRRREYLYDLLSEYIIKCIGTEPEKDNMFYKAAKAAANKQRDAFDIESFFEAKGLLRHSDKWRESAVYSMRYFFRQVAKEAKDAVDTLNNYEFKMHLEQLELLKKESNEIAVALIDLKLKIKKSKESQQKQRNDIEEYKNSIKINLERKENVKRVFIKHFYFKKQELEQRIEREPSAELKAMLFLVLSSIYLNMKPYLEENENE